MVSWYLTNEQRLHGKTFNKEYTCKRRRMQTIFHLHKIQLKNSFIDLNVKHNNKELCILHLRENLKFFTGFWALPDLRSDILTHGRYFIIRQAILLLTINLLAHCFCWHSFSLTAWAYGCCSILWSSLGATLNEQCLFDLITYVQFLFLGSTLFHWVYTSISAKTHITLWFCLCFIEVK